jgi:hypothetical protein
MIKPTSIFRLGLFIRRHFWFGVGSILLLASGAAVAADGPHPGW